jgi:Mrp family chromosome partitioning ATPase
LVQRASTANGLPVVTAGLSPPQPTDLLGSPKLRTALEAWKREYQYILIDTPPILVAPDSAALATLVDWILFLIRANRTQGEAALAGKQRLVDVGAKLIGGVLNGARLDLERGYRFYYYYRESKRYRRDHPGPPVP